MSTAGDARAAISAALIAGGVRVPSGQRIAAPCVIVEAGEPWSEPARLPGRLTRWRLTAIASAADSEAALEELGTLVDAVDVGLHTLQGVQLPTWSRPADLTLEGVPRAATVAAITYTARSDGG